MSMLLRYRARFRALFTRAALDRDLDRELAQWVGELAARYEQAGMSPGDARRRALVETGGIEQVKERVRDARPRPLWDSLVRDASYACRSLLRAPGLFAAVVVTLALGIGANTAVYSVVHTILLQPPPYRAPDRLAIIWGNMGAATIPRARLAGPEVVDFQKEATTLSGVAAIQPFSAAITGDGDPEQVTVARVTWNFFDVLGVNAAAGRTFAADDGYPTAAPPVVISWPLFLHRMGGDPTAIGTRLVLDGASVQVVGVLRSDFSLQFRAAIGLSDAPQVFQPFGTDLAAGNRLIRLYNVVARLADDSTMAAAANQIAAIGDDLARRDPTYKDARHSFYLVPLSSDSTREVRPMLLGLLAGVVVVLLVACVNVGGLLLARAAGRRREIATLVALGADRVRLVRQFVIEGLMIAATGAVAGVATGAAVLRAIVALRPPSLEQLQSATIDAPVLALVATIGGVWGLLFALAPLVEFSRLDVTAGLESRAGTAGRPRSRARATLVVVQIALGTILVVAASLLVRSTNALYQVDAGFDLNARALAFRVTWPADRYPTGAEVNVFSRDLETRLTAFPGVLHVGSISHMPFDGASAWSGKYVTLGQNTPEGLASARFADMRAVSPGALQLLGVRLVSGRWFSEDDDRSGAPVSIVDECLASRAWPGQSAIGQRLRLPIEIDRRVAAIWTTVVGVVGHTRYRSLDGEVQEQAYVSARQTLRQASMSYVLRTATNPVRLAPDVSRVVASIDPLLPAYDVKPFQAYVTRAMSARRFTTVLASSFAFLALVLAAVGLTGVVSYSVTSRRREFGVRLALGATPIKMQSAVLREALLLVGAGIGAGLAVATAATSAMRSLLFGVSPTDVASYAGAFVLLALVGLTASWWPARCAGGINPAETLRSE